MDKVQETTSVMNAHGTILRRLFYFQPQTILKTDNSPGNKDDSNLRNRLTAYNEFE